MPELGQAGVRVKSSISVRDVLFPPTHLAVVGDTPGNPCAACLPVKPQTGGDMRRLRYCALSLAVAARALNT
jgi:hypothetical protein